MVCGGVSSEIETDNYSLTFSNDFNQLEVVAVGVSDCAVVCPEVGEDGVGDDQGGHGPVPPPLGDHLVVAGPGVDGIIFVFPHHCRGWRH